MELLLQRLYLKTEYTIGRLSVDGLYFLIRWKIVYVI